MIERTQLQAYAHNLQNVITALCDREGRCTLCYRRIEGDSCEQCKEYYLDCDCEPMTPKEIVNDYDW